MQYLHCSAGSLIQKSTLEGDVLCFGDFVLKGLWPNRD